MQYSSSSENYVSSMKNSPSRWSGDENDKYAYKKACYKYSTSGSSNFAETSGSTAASNIDQLDTLLEDLKNERRISKEKDYGLPSSSYIVREHEKNTSTTPLLSTKTTKTFETSPNYKTNKYYNEYQCKEIINEESPVIVKNTTKTTLDKEIDDIALPANILPPPGTKVTTTVRTYTYEIPAGESTTDYSSTINRNIMKRTDEAADMAAYELTQRKLPAPVTQLHSESYSSSSKTEPLPRTSPNSTIYHAEMYSSSSKTDKLVPPVAPVTNIYHSENYSSSHKTDKILPPVAPVTNIYHSENYSSSQKTDRIVPPVAPVTNIYHSENYTSSHKTEKLPVLPATSPYQSEPLPMPSNQVYELREVREVTNTRSPLPGPHSTHNTIVYNVSSTPRAPSEPRSTGPEHLYGRTINKSITTSVDRSVTPLPPPTHESLASYHYSSSTTSTNLRNGPDYGPPQGKPAPFPVERDLQVPVERTPTKVDDLMQSFESTELKSSEVDAPHRKREVDTSTASPKQQHVPSINRAGKEVFYPPGHEMMLTKRQEMSAAQGGGRWAKASGMYEYEAGAKSSSKSKSGGTMVPVCLPLCCAMPCSIM